MSNLLMYGAFNVGLLIVILIDLGLFSKKPHQVTTKEAISWSIVWFSLALLFCAGIYVYMPNGEVLAAEFLSGYLVEKSLSVDNLFVFYMIFKYFKTDPKDQHKVLMYGIIGAIVMRSIMIFAGAALIEQFHWLMYVFGAFLVFTGLKLMFVKEEDEEEDIGNNKVVKTIQKVLPNASIFLITVITVELMDVLFALDSIPAIFGITTNPMIIYTSNVFAIMGLRAMYFLIANIIEKFYYLQHALAIILTFVGTKMLIADFYHVSTYVSLGIIVGTMAVAVISSIIRDSKVKA